MIVRILLGTMIPVGALTFIPNCMMSDKYENEIASEFGIASSFLFMTGGFLGLFHGKNIPIRYSYACVTSGIILQVVAFGMLKS
jgi:hypothetical protein